MALATQMNGLFPSIYLCENIEVVELRRLFFDAKRVSMGSLGNILSSCILIEYLGTSEGQREMKLEN
jgi:hypothetical protein